MPASYFMYSILALKMKYYASKNVRNILSIINYFGISINEFYGHSKAHNNESNKIDKEHFNDKIME